MPESEQTSPMQVIVSPKQGDLIKACREKRVVLASGPRRSGKCVSPDTILYTTRGLVRFGELLKDAPHGFGNMMEGVTSYDTSHHDLVRSLTAQSYREPENDAITLTLDTGYEITGSMNHPVWCEIHGLIGYRTLAEIDAALSSGSQCWLPLVVGHADWRRDYVNVRFAPCSPSELKAWERIEKVTQIRRRGEWSALALAAKTGYTPRTITKILNGVTPQLPSEISITLDDDLAYILGVLVGDGCLTEAVLKDNAPHFSTADPEIVESVTAIIGKRFPNCVIKKATGIYDYAIQCPVFKRFCWAVGIAGKYAHEKTIPDVIIRSPKSVLRSFLQGLFDTDGTVEGKGYVTFCSSSRELARDVQRVLLAFGVKASLKFKKNSHRGAWIISCHTSAREFYKEIGFRLPRKAFGEKKLPKSARSCFPTYPPSLRVALVNAWRRNRDSKDRKRFSRQIHRQHLWHIMRGAIGIAKHRFETFMELVQCASDSNLLRYYGNGKLWWQPVKLTSRTKTELYDLSVPLVHNFIGNGIINHNTLGCEHCVADHAWRTDRANIVAITISQSAGIDSGVWPDIVNHVLPLWIAEGKLRWHKKPYIQNVTKKPSCELINGHGTVSVIQLDSLNDEDEVEERYREKRYSMIYVNQLSNFRSQKTFRIWMQALRALHLRHDQMVFLGDTNPSDEGERSWIYQLWYVLRNAQEGQYDPKLKALKESLALVEMMIHDNPFLSQADIDQLVADYADDPDLYARYIEGRWVQATTNAIFSSTFRHTVHVIGEIETPGNPDPEIMVPSDDCWQLITGWDPGNSANSAAVLIEKEVRVDQDGKPLPAIFKVIDELVVVGQEHRLQEFVEQFVEKLHEWEKRMGKRFSYFHWSDRSVFDMKEPVLNRYYHQLIHEFSGGEITLTAANRAPGSIAKRVDITRRLLFEQRLFVSNDRCPNVIQMFKAMPKGKSEVNIIPVGNRHKHVFDALSYPLAEECAGELTDAVIRRIRTRRPSEMQNDEGLILIPS